MRYVEPKNVREAMQRLVKLDKQRHAFYNDEMDCPCVSDFIEDFERIERNLCEFILKHSPKNSRRYNYAMGRIEAYMP